MNKAKLAERITEAEADHEAAKSRSLRADAKAEKAYGLAEAARWRLVALRAKAVK